MADSTHSILYENEARWYSLFIQHFEVSTQFCLQASSSPLSHMPVTSSAQSPHPTRCSHLTRCTTSCSPLCHEYGYHFRTAYVKRKWVAKKIEIGHENTGSPLLIWRLDIHVLTTPLLPTAINCNHTTCMSPRVWTWETFHNCFHGLRVFENRVLRRIFGPKRDEVRVSSTSDLEGRDIAQSTVTGFYLY
jgi:hypothetical protein